MKTKTGTETAHNKTNHDVHSNTCPIQETAQLLSDTWTMLIIRDILSGPKRFCELERSLTGISTRTLTLKLKKLIQEGLLTHSKDNLYTATAKAKGLQTVIRAMKRYSSDYLHA